MAFTRRRKQPAPVMKVPVPFSPIFGKHAPIGGQQPDLTRVGLFRVLQEEDDYLICEGIDPERPIAFDSGNPVSVAKPYLLMRSPWDGTTAAYGDQVIAFSYSEKNVRMVSVDGGDPVIQTIAPPYFIGDILTVVRTRNVTGDSIGMLDGYGRPIEFIDLNSGGRMWSPADVTSESVYYFAIINSDANCSNTTFQVSLYGQTTASILESPAKTNLVVTRTDNYYAPGELVAVVYANDSWRVAKLHDSTLWSTDVIGKGTVGLGRSVGGTVDVTYYGPVFDALPLIGGDLNAALNPAAEARGASAYLSLARAYRGYIPLGLYPSGQVFDISGDGTGNNTRTSDVIPGEVPVYRPDGTISHISIGGTYSSMSATFQNGRTSSMSGPLIMTTSRPYGSPSLPDHPCVFLSGKTIHGAFSYMKGSSFNGSAGPGIQFEAGYPIYYL